MADTTTIAVGHGTKRTTEAAEAATTTAAAMNAAATAAAADATTNVAVMAVVEADATTNVVTTNAATKDPARWCMVKKMPNGTRHSTFNMHHVCNVCKICQDFCRFSPLYAVVCLVSCCY